MKLLHIDSSILGENSVSRTLTAEIVARLTALHSDADVVYRDLTAESAMHLSGGHLAVRFGAQAEAPDLAKDLEKAERDIQDLIDADTIVIGAPMYNFTVPTQLKAWIDRIVVAGRTFKYSDAGTPVSLLPEGKKVIIASTRGGAYLDASMAGLEHQESYLKGVLGFIGLTDVTIIRAEGLAMGEEAKDAAISRARGEIAELAA
ncbi:NAD(P)H-dependent oxidoreductase [uncultured Roseibium sp.]|uniref:FMN-dependent NADH-azoreductase n=1 Tax=uncultured Roseibium sp. TaxID=1936171 RepID=UPI003217ADF1